MAGSTMTALLLTAMGAAGTALGGLMVVAQPKMDFKRLGVLQGVAAGLMLCISVFDLFPEAQEEIGFAQANLWFFAGVLFFAVIVAYIPEPPSGMVVTDEDPKSEKDKRSAAKQAPTAEASVLPPTPGRYPLRSRSLANDQSRAQEATPLRQRKGRTESASQDASHAHGSGTVSPPTSPQRRRLQPAGSSEHPMEVTSEALAKPSAADRPGEDEAAASYAAKRRVLMSGLITALGIALHNFPEGVAVFLASMKSARVGASLAFAIALHNIPEGVAVSLPVYFATGSRLKGFLYAFVSGLAEPLAVVVLALFFPSNLDKQLIDKLLAAVGGIMAFLALHELLPLSIEHAGRTAAVAALFAGMALMSANLTLLDVWLGDLH